MIIKEAILQEEKDQVKAFLQKFELEYEDDATVTYYLEDDEKIVGTISCADYIIKYLAVDKSYQNENLSGLLVNQALQYFRVNNINSYQVFTKPENKTIFESFGFRKIIETSNVIMLEAGTNSIIEELEKIKKQLEIRFAILDESSDIASVVVNANPMTLGHEYLIEEASKLHKMVVVFVVEENKSEFSFQERLSMVYLATRKYANVCVLPSTKYIVSSLTFPTYFLKEKDSDKKEWAMVDALIFKNYFMKHLFIKKRYVGSETSNKMVSYNNTLKEILKDDLVIIERLKQENASVSASKVRELLKQQKFEEALSLVPRENMMVLRGIAYSKYGKN